MKNYIFLLGLAALLLSANDSPFKNVPTKVNYSSYGKILGNNIVYIGIDSTLSTMGIWYKNIVNNDEFELHTKPYSFPIGWLDDKNVAIFEKEGKEKKIIAINIETGKTTNILDINSVISPETDVCIDNGVVVFTCQSSRPQDVITYKFNFLDKKLLPIDKLVGENIIKVAYNYKNDIVAYVRLEKNGDKYLEVFDSNKITRIAKYPLDNFPDEIPITFSDDGKELFYVENTDNAIIKKYELNTGMIESFYMFPLGVNCIDLSYSQGKLLFTVNIEGEGKVTYETNHINSKYNCKMEFENGRKLFYFEL